MNKDLSEIVKECEKSVGYILFVGIVTKEHDKNGNNLIQFRYARHHLSFEDSKIAQEEFKKQIAKDREDYFQEEEHKAESSGS